jgi:hypothetical protein
MMKKMVVLVVAMLAVIVVGAVPALADEVQNQRDGSSSSSNSNNGTVGEKPLRDPGIRQCDITPTECDNTDDPQEHKKNEHNDEDEEPLKDPGIRQCDITPTECDNTDDPQEHKKNEHNDEDEYPEYCKGIVYDPRACDMKNEHSQNSDDSQNGQGHNTGARPDADDPNKPDKEESKEEATSSPGGVKAGVVPWVIAAPAQEEENDASGAPKEAVSAPVDEAGQTANGETVIGDVCFYDDYVYVEEVDACVSNEPFFGILFGDVPGPDSVGGYVGLLGQFVEDAGTGAGIIVDQGLGYVGDALVEFGEDGGPIGWAIQGVGYTLGFIGEAGGGLIGAAGQTVGAVVDGVGEAIDAVGDAVGDAWDEVASWW